MPDKPDNIRLVTDDFKTPAKRAAARDILLLWPRIKNFEELSRRTGWSPPHLREVFDTHFEGVEDPDDASNPIEADVVDSIAETGLTDQEVYREGYRDGYRDGQADA